MFFEGVPKSGVAMAPVIPLALALNKGVLTSRTQNGEFLTYAIFTSNLLSSAFLIACYVRYI